METLFSRIKKRIKRTLEISNKSEENIRQIQGVTISNSRRNIIGRQTDGNWTRYKIPPPLSRPSLRIFLNNYFFARNYLFLKNYLLQRNYFFLRNTSSCGIISWWMTFSWCSPRGGEHPWAPCLSSSAWDCLRAPLCGRKLARLPHLHQSRKKWKNEKMKK